ncbi:pyruvate dehydrogenase E1 component alpha subunit [Steroidobacter denitrificans]|uniref:Pyruvate dehydrogenase E1 component alpha subunit n=1 Tax=Steroidobacter denitrificans TaxID=465721 RepID=A0A127F5P1_STEDE|nr:thiamine pyrophosphate-dependent dehydrogenase E1 component subunit alpha [Steroidobacter denitrificans]AMN45756.1 pyruvate dehydrogenase E1 component alpha subunit [Steroidobacter denitrificans]
MPLTNDIKLNIYRYMYAAERWEATLLRLIEQGVVSGIYHAGRGHEGTEVGAVFALDKNDYLFYDHRGCGHLIAKGADMTSLYGDFLGNELGSTRGLGAGIVHVCDPDLGIMGQSGTLGRGQLLATGAALSAKLRGTTQVAMHFFGDGSSNLGTFHEACNVAGAWKLPVVFIVQNNGWAVSVPIEYSTAGGGIARRADAYAMPGLVVDGTDAFAVYETTSMAVERARRGEGPTLIEAKLVRMRGHFEGDPDHYRPKDADARKDPLVRTRQRLLDEKVADEAQLTQLESTVKESVQAAVESARRGTMPGRSRIFEGIYV